MGLEGGEVAMHRSRPGSIRIESSGCEPRTERTLFQSPGQVDRSMGSQQIQICAGPDCPAVISMVFITDHGSWVDLLFPYMVIDESALN
jgi:hypothetical protein